MKSEHTEELSYILTQDSDDPDSSESAQGRGNTEEELCNEASSEQPDAQALQKEILEIVTELEYEEMMTKEEVLLTTDMGGSVYNTVAAHLSILSLDGKIGYYNDDGKAKYFSISGLDTDKIKADIVRILELHKEGIELEDLHPKLGNRRHDISVGLRILIKEGKVKKEDGIPDYYNRDVYYLVQDSSDKDESVGRYGEKRGIRQRSSL